MNIVTFDIIIYILPILFLLFFSSNIDKLVVNVELIFENVS